MQEQPNIIFVITDQQRADTIGAAGCDWMITPTLDRLAEDSVTFTNGFCCGATCISSRAALFTGMHAHNTGVYSFDHWEHHRTWLHELRDAGYYVANVGKMHHRDAMMAFHERYIVENKSSTLKYDQWNRFLWQMGLDVPKRHETVEGWPHKLNAVAWEHDEAWQSDIFTGDMALRFLDRWDQRAPLFLEVGFPGPHEPYDPPPRFIEMYADKKPPKRIHARDELDGKPPPQRQLKEWFATHHHEHRIDFSGAEDADIARLRRHYYANITAIDEKLGQLLAALEAKGMLENSIIVFTSDHGDNVGDHDMPYKWFMYDTITRVPFMVRTPKTVGTGRTDTGLISQIDLGPTLLELAGVPIPSRLDGQSRRARVQDGDTSDAPDAVFCEENYVTMIRTQDKKLVYYAGKPFGELYDLANDPNELQNLYDAEQHRPLRDQLERRLFEWHIWSTFMNGGYKNADKPDYAMRTGNMIGPK